MKTMAGKKTKKYLTKEEALTKLQKYCAYQDRCHKEVRSKLLDLGVYGQDLELIIVELIKDKFLNEVRFAQSFVRGKFRMKRWGRNKIKQELKQRDLSDYCIKKGMQEIDESEYLEVLDNLLSKKETLLKEDNRFEKNRKLAKYAIQKGFESFITWERIKKLFPAG